MFCNQKQMNRAVLEAKNVNKNKLAFNFQPAEEDSHRTLRTVSVTVCWSITLLMAVQASTFVFNSGLAVMA